MKLDTVVPYLKWIQNIYKCRDTPMSSHFHWTSATFVVSWNTDIDLILTLSWRRLLSYRNQSIDLQNKSMDWFLYDNGPRHERVNASVLILLTFFDSLKVVLIIIVAILMMSAKLSTLGLLKINVFWNNGYDVRIFVHAVINKILTCDSNYIVEWSCDQTLVTLAFLWEKLS